MTGPFWPFAPWWMCAMVPFRPSVVTLPVMVPSCATRNVPLPFASVFAGGTSSAPVRLTFIAPEPGIQDGILSRIELHPAATRTAAMSAANVTMLFTISSRSSNDLQIETSGRLEYSHACHRRFQRAFAPAHSRLYARARGADLRAPVRRLRRRRDQDRVAARRRSEREHGRTARRSGHAEPAPQQARNHAQP